jgi:hypothetical protein
MTIDWTPQPPPDPDEQSRLATANLIRALAQHPEIMSTESLEALEVAERYQRATTNSTETNLPGGKSNDQERKTTRQAGPA